MEQHEPKETSFYREAPNPGPKTGPRGTVGKGTPSSRLKRLYRSRISHPESFSFREFVAEILEKNADAKQWLKNKEPVKPKVRQGPYGKGCW